MVELPGLAAAKIGARHKSFTIFNNILQYFAILKCNKLFKYYKNEEKWTLFEKIVKTYQFIATPNKPVKMFQKKAF